MPLHRLWRTLTSHRQEPGAEPAARDASHPGEEAGAEGRPPHRPATEATRAGAPHTPRADVVDVSTAAVAELESHCHELLGRVGAGRSPSDSSPSISFDALTRGLAAEGRWTEVKTWLGRYFELPQERRRADPADTVRALLGRLVEAERRSDAVADWPGCWVPTGESIVLDGREIPGGLLYVGRSLPSVSDPHAVEPALINPARVVDWASPDRDGAGMGYWPSYSSIGSSCRAAYLEWLIDGRRDPAACIGYVYLYFYGLERRVLHDLRDASPDHPELPLIEAEVRRLLGVYAGNHSFRSYATTLLDVLSVRNVPDRRYRHPPPVRIGTGDLPLALRAGLAQVARDGVPLPWEWALGWYLMTSRHRSPVERCPDELHELFRLRYREEHGEGLRLRHAKARLEVRHHPASASFRGLEVVVRLDLPDVTRLTAPLRRIEQVAERCCDELDPYSRLIAKDPGAAGGLLGLAVLPRGLEGLAAGEVGARFEELVCRVEGGTGRSVIVDSDELLDMWPARDPGKLRKREAVQLAQLLERHDVGIDPDVRFGGRPLRAGTKAALFPLPPARATAPTPGFEAGSLLVTLATAVAGADDGVSEDEERSLETHLETALGLAEDERARLAAHLDRLLAEPLSLTGLKRRVERLDRSERHAIGRFLVRVAASDGRVDPSEVRILARSFRLLGLDPGSVHAELHALSTGAGARTPPEEPVAVRPGRPSPGRSIPTPPAHEAAHGRLLLDEASIEAKLRETRRVSLLLEDVLADDEDVLVGTTPAGPASDRQESALAVPGLDGAHARLLLALVEREEWPWDEVEALAEGLGLLPDGALERINDVALERVDAPACEAGDPLWIDLQVTKELLA